MALLNCARQEGILDSQREFESREVLDLISIRQFGTDLAKLNIPVANPTIT